MEEKIDIAAIASVDSVSIFHGVGIHSYLANDADEVDRIIFSLANKKCKIIYVSEEIYEMIPSTLEKYKTAPFPMIIPLPLGEVSQNIGLKKIQDNVEKAIGMDIF